MKAEIISTGTELLLGKTLNTSAFYLTGQLSGLGMEVVYHTTVGDNQARLLEALGQALKHSQIVFLTGGLGPTADDMTKEAVAHVLGLDMVFNQDWMDTINNFYSEKITLPPGSDKQAVFPAGAKILQNEKGTAPGAIIEKDSKYCVIMPGPPSEMKVMFDHHVLPELQRIIKTQKRMYVRVLKVFGLGESELEQKITDIMSQSSPFVTLLDKHTYMDLRVTIKTGDQEKAYTILNNTESIIRKRLGDSVFGVDDETHAQIVGNLLRKNKLTLATAESCSGGLLGGRLTEESGSSDYYLGGAVSYANSAKEILLGVNSDSLTEHGAVSEIVAKEMAEGAKMCLQADLGLSITGIAGPSGGTEEKPVGLVYIGLAHPQGVEFKKCQFVGTRESIRNMSVETALNMIRLYLLKNR